MVLVRVNSLLNKTVKNPHKLCDVTHKKYSPECNVLIYTGLGGGTFIALLFIDINS